MHGDKIQLLADRISHLRKGKGLSIENLAMRVGISKGNLSDIENGKRDLRLSTLEAIARGLGLTMSELVSGL